MATKSYWKGQNLGFYDPAYNSGYKGNLWTDCPLAAINQDPSIAHVFFEDFNANQAATLAGWTATQSGGVGTWALGVTAGATAAGGWADADSGSTTVTEGINVQFIGDTFVPAAGKDIWFEAKWMVTDTYDDCELFVGLSEPDTAIIDTSANESESHIGWQCVTDDGVVLFTSEKATAGTTKTAGTIAEATAVRTGFKVNGITSVEHWWNGVKISTTALTANIPIVAMAPSIVCQSGGTADCILSVDYIKAVQIR